MLAQRGKWKMLATEQKSVALYDIEAQYREYTNLQGTQPEVKNPFGRKFRRFIKRSGRAGRR